MAHSTLTPTDSPQACVGPKPQAVTPGIEPREHEPLRGAGVEAGGDGLHDQAHALRELRRRIGFTPRAYGDPPTLPAPLPPGPAAGLAPSPPTSAAGIASTDGLTGTAHCIAIASGKGGVGKSVLATNLAAALAQRGMSVILLDADMGTANADVMCGVPTRGNVAHVVAGRCRPADILVDTPGGFRLLPGASGLLHAAAMNTAERRRLIDQVRQLESQCDVLLIDCGAGLHPTVLSFALASDQLWLVTTPQPTALADAYALIKAMRLNHGVLPPLGTVVNQVVDQAQGREVYRRLRRTARQFLDLPIRFVGSLPEDGSVPASVIDRTPIFFPQSESSRQTPFFQAMVELAQTVARDVGVARR